LLQHNHQEEVQKMMSNVLPAQGGVSASEVSEQGPFDPERSWDTLGRRRGRGRTPRCSGVIPQIPPVPLYDLSHKGDQLGRRSGLGLKGLKRVIS
jgi:hypothetical protein